MTPPSAAPSGSHGYIEGGPTEDVHQAANDQSRQAVAYLFGRRLHETMGEPRTQDLDKE